MGKYAKYEKKYKQIWETYPQFKKWLTYDKENDTAFCKVCQTKLRPHKTDLERHSKRAVHINNIEKRNPKKQPKITTTAGTSLETNEHKIADIKLALHIAVLQTANHLSELLIELSKHLSAYSGFQNLKLHRTKCSSIIKYVIGPALEEELIKDIGNSYYSLIIDESTDISVFKYMAVCIRYFSNAKSQIVTKYLGIFEVISATAEVLTDSLLQFLSAKKLSLSKLLGLATDGANNLCGQHHSVYTLLKNKVPRLILIKCVAHSLHLATSRASESLREFFLQRII
ncbi:uncharacterized protein LOC105840987 [Monomorium pharaonis]|uniref:uncharacterized protein LOC105840987 n=1 Tax=Monomorium pharaonis TaxID=307658 RepID=UPI00063F6640|nr:uncharacterized protein LOC105840987 [Monomorium pharaonis]